MNKKAYLVANVTELETMLAVAKRTTRQHRSKLDGSRDIATVVINLELTGSISEDDGAVQLDNPIIYGHDITALVYAKEGRENAISKITNIRAVRAHPLLTA